MKGGVGALKLCGFPNFRQVKPPQLGSWSCLANLVTTDCTRLALPETPANSIVFFVGQAFDFDAE